MARIKIVHNSDVRRISDSVLKAQNPYAALVEYVRAIFRIPADLEPAQLVLAYTDDEGDVVTISSALELREAIRIAQQENRRSLKIFLSTAGPEGAYLAARTASLGQHPPSDTFSDLGSASQIAGGDDAGAHSPRSEGEGSFVSFVHVDEGQQPSNHVASESVASEPVVSNHVASETVASDTVASETAAPEHKADEDDADWTGFPEPAQLHEWFSDFMANMDVQAELPKAVSTTYEAMLSGEVTLDQALNRAFDACPAIAQHALVAQTRAFLPLIVTGVRQWVSTLVPLGEPMLQILAPQILQLLPGMFDGGRPDMELDITDAFYQLRAQEQRKKNKQAKKERRAKARAEKRQQAQQAAAAASHDEDDSVDDEDDDNEIHITIRVPKWLRRVLTQQRDTSRRPCGGRPRRARGSRPPCGFGGMPGMEAFAGLAGLFGGLGGFPTPPAPPAPQGPPAPSTDSPASAAPEPEKPQEQPPSPTPKYDAVLTNDTHVPPGTPLPPSAIVLKRWTLTNTGTTAWPLGTKLIRRNVDRGFKMEHEFEVPPAVPGQTVDVMALVQVPNDVGKRFRASYCLRTPFPEGTFLGPQLFVDFVVDANAVVPTDEPPAAAKDAEEEKQQQQQQQQEEEEQRRLEAERAEQARLQAEEEARAKAEAEAARAKAEEEARMKAEEEVRLAEERRQAEEAARQAEEAAAAAAAAVPAQPPVDPRWEIQLTGLASMGFGNRETNVFLLQKHNGDMHRVVSELVQGP